jgi:WD40 repeat protein
LTVPWKSFDNQVHFLDLAAGNYLPNLKGAVNGVQDMAFSPDGNLLAMSGTDNRVRLRDMTTGTTTVLPGQPGNENALRFSPTGKFLAAASSDKKAWLWHVTT